MQRAVNEARLEGHFGLSVSDFRNSSVWETEESDNLKIFNFVQRLRI